jgi:MAP kinase interacting serine/threonine kinase
MFYFDEDHQENGFDAPTNTKDWDSTDEADDEQPTELVPLGMKTGNGVFGSRHRKIRSSFFDYYKLTEDFLGSGAYASVRTGISIATGKEFAIKLIDKRQGHSRSRIMREIDTFQICKHHPNIVQLHEWFEDLDYFYLVFEKMRGGPLLNHIQRKVYFTEQEASMVTKDIASALKYLHDKGIAHRDIKPENILCIDPDRVSPVKLCDFDLASKMASSSLTVTTSSMIADPELASPVGSAEFMAPEVVDAFVGDALKYDKRCDMWSLGVIIYIMLCGYPPFYGECWRDNCGWDQGESCADCQENLFARIQLGEYDFPEEEWCRVSHEAKDLISRLLVKDVRVRYTADDVLKHPWVQNGAPRTPLQTPGNLYRNDSARDVLQMQEHFSALNRMAVVGRLSNRSAAAIDQSALGNKSTNNLMLPPPTSLQQRKPSQGLETCQTAMARQDSTNELRRQHRQQQRETQVNV